MADLLELILGIVTHMLYRNRNGALQTRIRWTLYVTTAFSLLAGLAFGMFSVILSDTWANLAIGFGILGGLVIIPGELHYGSKRATMVFLGLAGLTAVVAIMRAIYWPSLLPW